MEHIEKRFGGWRDCLFLEGVGLLLCNQCWQPFQHFFFFWFLFKIPCSVAKRTEKMMRDLFRKDMEKVASFWWNIPLGQEGKEGL